MAQPPTHVPPAVETSAALPKLRVADAPKLARRDEAPLRGLQRSLGNRAMAKLAAPGRPLEPAVRADLEARFGEDLGSVRIHHDPKAAESEGTSAFATGEHIVSKQPLEHPDADRRLLAHEAAHVVQQRRGGRNEPSNDERLEAAAKQTAHEVTHRGHDVDIRGKARVGIARDEGAPPQHQFTTVQAKSGLYDLSIDGITVLHYQQPEDSKNLEVAAAAFDDPKVVSIGVRGARGTTVLLDPLGIAELKKRGYDVKWFDQRQSEDLGEHPIHLSRIDVPPPQRHRPPLQIPKQKPPEEKPPEQQLEKLPEKPSDLPVADQPSVPQKTPKDLIDSRTTWYGDLDEDALGADLLKHAIDGNADYAQRVIDELGSTDRDDVSLGFAQAATDEQLRQLASTEKGRRLLDRLFDELTAGEVFADEQRQADRILRIKTHSLLSEEQFAAKVAKARTSIVLPYRKGGLTVLTPSPIYARRLPDGKVGVHVRFDIAGTEYARDPDLRLPLGISDEVILDEDAVVGVKLYDQGGTIDFVPALSLLQLENEATRMVYEKSAEAVGIGLTLGLGGEAAAGEEALQGKALSTTAQMAATARKGVAVADRFATALDVTNSLVQEHRGWIIETWGKDGRDFVTDLDAVNSYIRVYGLVRGGVGLVQLGNALRKSYKNWRAVTTSAKNLSERETADIEKIAGDAEHLLQELDSTAQQNVAPTDVPGELSGDAEVRDISSGRKRVYPPETQRRLERTREGAGDVLPMHGAGEQDFESELSQHAAQAQLEDEPLQRASGDIETHAMAGPRRPQQRPVVQQPAQQQRGTTRTTTRSSTGGDGTGVAPPRVQLRRVLPEHLDEPRLLPRGIDNYSAGDGYDFFRRNRSRYPKHVQDMIDDVKRPTKTANANIDQALREYYAQQANTTLGFAATSQKISRPAPVAGGRILEESSPFSTAEKGHAPSRANPGTEVEAGFSPTPLGERKNLNLVGHTKSGEVVKLDDFNFRARSGEELKMPYALQHDPAFRANCQQGIIDELRRHYEFTRDWNFNPYRWNLLTYEDYETVYRLARQYLPSDWERYVSITWIQ
ncbi:MAG TPA: DUF4157 domain-containing protein [Candidatus Cybelea sp.]|jgi:hypothetical protein